MDSKRKLVFSYNDTAMANELNHFYTQFETYIFLESCEVLDKVICNVCDDRMLIDPCTVTKDCKTKDIKKARGPDGMSAFLLRRFGDKVISAMAQTSPDLTMSILANWRQLFTQHWDVLDMCHLAY